MSEHKKKKIRMTSLKNIEIFSKESNELLCNLAKGGLSTFEALFI